MLSHAHQEDPCPWTGLLIRLADPIFPDPRYNNKVLFKLLHVPAGDRMFSKHNRRCYNVLQGGMDVAPSFPKACVEILATPEALWDLFSPDKGTENSNSNISKDSLWPTT